MDPPLDGWAIAGHVRVGPYRTHFAGGRYTWEITG